MDLTQLLLRLFVKDYRNTEDPAVRARYDIFGTVAIACITGMGGGIIRDILLQNYGLYALGCSFPAPWPAWRCSTSASWPPTWTPSSTSWTTSR